MRKLRPVFVELVAAVRHENLSDDRIKEILKKNDYRYFERFLRDTISDITESDVSAEMKISDVSGFSAYLRKKVKNSRGWKQALSLRTLSYFRCKDNIAVFRSIIKSSNFPQSILAAGLGLALCDDYDSMEEVFNKIYDTTLYNEDVLLMIISAYGADSAVYLHKLLMNEKASINESCIMVDALGIFRFKPAVPALKKLLLSTSSLELSLHIMDALKYVGDNSLANELVAFLSHDNYQMRAKAALTISTLGGPDYISQFEPLLQDRKWWVRRNAAEAILNTGMEGLKKLKELSRSGEEFPRSAAQLLLTDLRFNKLGIMISE